jgi:hypothetical protein
VIVLIATPSISSSDNTARASGETIRIELHGRLSVEAPDAGSSAADGAARVQFISECSPVGGLEAVLDCLNTPCPEGTVRGTLLDLTPDADGERPVIDRFSDGCFGGEDPGFLEVVVAAEFRDSVSPSGVVVQPGTGRALVNLPLVAHAEPVTDTWSPTLLGAPVTIRATPTSYSWDFGDGAPPVVTDHAGAPYPDHAAEHTYLTTGDRTITLTTTYTGQYSLDSGATWLPVPGTATATSPPVPVRLVEARAQLVG